MLKLRFGNFAGGPKAGLLAVAVLLTAGSVLAEGNRSSVFTMTNAVDNAVVAYYRAPNGTLRMVGSYPTQGKGMGGGLGSQGPLALSEDGDWLVAVNAGSNDITVFSLERRGLMFRSRTPSGGTMPISVTIHDERVFVVNAGGTPNINGYKLDEDGMLTPLPGSWHALSGAGPAQIAFNPEGDVLLVTMKASNTIEAFRLNDDMVYGPFSQSSAGQTPFGFMFDKRGHMIVTEAFGGAPHASAVTSYDVSETGHLTAITSSLGTTQTSACWMVVTGDGKYGYTANTPASTLTGVRILRDGRLELMYPVAGSLPPGSAPIDMAVTNNNRYLYSVNSGTGSIGMFRIAPDGSLSALGTMGGLPTSIAGIAAR